jgi:transposase InsO family protein
MTYLKFSAEPIEVITTVQRRRPWSAEEKRAMVEEAEQPGSSVSQVARKYGVNVSNGMAEAFIKTFKRDYVALHRLDHSQVVLEQLPEWFKDYNENHPHRGLKMMSPREYRQSL